MTASFSNIQRPDGTPLHLLSSGERFSDERVRRAAEVVDYMGVVDQLERWRQEARKGPGGRHETFPLRSLLVGLVLVAVLSEPMQLSRVCDILCRRISGNMRAELGLPLDVEFVSTNGRKNAYRNVRTRFRTLVDLMDPSDTPKDRKLDAEAFLARCEALRSLRSDAERAVAFERLHWFVNRIVEASFLMLPREARRNWKGSLAVDATVVPAFARPEKRAKKKKDGASVLKRSSSDPDAGWYMRTADDEGEGKGRETIAKAVWGYEATLAVTGDVESAADAPRFPSLVVGMAPLHKPGAEPGVNAVRALTSVVERGHPVGYLAVDRAYSSSKPDDFQLRARALGYKAVFDYRKDQLGVQAEVHGLVQVEGAWYCPQMPPDLVDATADVRAGRIDEATYRTRVEARGPYEARPKAREDDDGHQRLLCPASRGAPTARCELKPATDVFDGKTPVRIRLTPEHRAHPPKACRQESVTVPPSAGAKFAQALRYKSPDHEFVYATLRNSVEGENAYLKDPGHQGMEQSGRRRVRGVAPQSILVAFQILGANIKKVESYLKELSGGPMRPRRPRTARRITAPLSSWDPRMPRPRPAGQPPPAA